MPTTPKKVRAPRFVPLARAITRMARLPISSAASRMIFLFCDERSIIAPRSLQVVLHLCVAGAHD
jgi:hypothetical protein